MRSRRLRLQVLAWVDSRYAVVEDTEGGAFSKLCTCSVIYHDAPSPGTSQPTIAGLGLFAKFQPRKRRARRGEGRGSINFLKNRLSIKPHSKSSSPQPLLPRLPCLFLLSGISSIRSTKVPPFHDQQPNRLHVRDNSRMMGTVPPSSRHTAHCMKFATSTRRDFVDKAAIASSGLPSCRLAARMHHALAEANVNDRRSLPRRPHLPHGRRAVLDEGPKQQRRVRTGQLENNKASSLPSEPSETRSFHHIRVVCCWSRRALLYLIYGQVEGGGHETFPGLSIDDGANRRPDGEQGRRNTLSPHRGPRFTRPRRPK